MFGNDPQVIFWLPPDVKAYVKAEAAASSQNSEIVRAIRTAMQAKGWAAPTTLPTGGA